MSMSLGIVLAENITLYQAGKKAFSVGLYSIALENFQQYLDDDGVEKRVESLYMSAISLYYLKQYNDSISYLEGINKEYPSSLYSKRSHYWFALNYYYSDRFNEAVLEFNISAKEKSYRDVSNLYIALSHIKMKNNQAAIKAFETVKDTPDVKPQFLEEAVYRLASLYLEEGKYNQSIIELNKIVIDFPSSKYYNDALKMLSDTYFLLEEWESAERSYELLKDLKPDLEYLYKRLSVVKWKLGLDDDALWYLTLYDINFGDDLDVLNMLGDIYFRRSEFDNAVNVYKKVDQLKGVDKRENSFRLATSYYKMGNYSSSFNYYNVGESIQDYYYSILSGLRVDIDITGKVLEMNSTFPGHELSTDAANRVINKYEDDNKITQLEELLLSLTSLYPQNIEYALTLGEIYLEQAKYEESLKYLSTGYHSESDYYENVSYKIGWIYYHNNELKRSITYFDRVSVESEDYFKALYSKGIALYRLGEVNEGRDIFEEIFNYETPYKEDVSYYLGQIYKEEYDYNSAVEFFRVASNKESLRVESLSNMAWSYYQMESYESALNIYKELGNSFNVANCYLNLKRFNEAIVYYQQHIDEDGEFKESSYYKVVEILYLLDRDDEAWDMIKEFHKNYPSSNFPKDLVINEADNRMYGGDTDAGITLYNKILEFFKGYPVWKKARFRKAEALYRNELYKESLELYSASIISNDSYADESVYKSVEILKELLDPELTLYVKELIDKKDGDRTSLVPLYITYIEQFINSDDTLFIIERELGVTSRREESHQLIYLNALYYYTRANYDSAEKHLLPLLSRGEVSDRLKIDATTLQGELMAIRGEYTEVIDLYLKLYLSYSDYTDPVSFVLYKALELAREIESPLIDRIENILRTEYKETYWGSRVDEE